MSTFCPNIHHPDYKLLESLTPYPNALLNNFEGDFDKAIEFAKNDSLTKKLLKILKGNEKVDTSIENIEARMFSFDHNLFNQINLVLQTNPNISSEKLLNILIEKNVIEKKCQ